MAVLALGISFVILFGLFSWITLMHPVSDNSYTTQKSGIVPEQTMLAGQQPALAKMAASLYSDIGVNNTKEWNIAFVIGKFLNSEPPKPDQTFKLQYRVINGTVESFDVRQEVDDVLVSNGIIASVNSSSGSSNSLLEIKFPRNFPYTNSPGGGIERFDFLANDQQISIEEDNKVTTDCFFVFSVPFTGAAEIEMWMPSILIKSPYHGDDVPDSCIPQTIATNNTSGSVAAYPPTPEMLDECSELGIAPENCNEMEIFKKRPRQVPLSEEEIKRIQNQQSQINNSMFMIGIGAAVAGAIAFVTLWKRK